MSFGRWTVFWLVVIGLLIVVELAEITRLFTVPLSLATLSPATFVFSLVLITILALVGAVFIGFYLSSQVYGRRGFTPFEQEMLRMRQDVAGLKQDLATLQQHLGAPSRGPSDPPERPPPPEPK